MRMGKYDIRRDNIGFWPKPLRIGVIITIAILLLLGTYLFLIRKQINKLNMLKHKETEKKLILAKKQQLAINVSAYEQQLKTAKFNIKRLIKQLPTQSEIPALIEEISKLGKAAGLQFRLLQPLTEKPYPFYIQLPIHIIVIGNFQQITNFIGLLSSMNRIVTVGKFTLRPNADTINALDQQPTLKLNFTANTYRYQLQKIKSKHKKVKQRRKK